MKTLFLVLFPLAALGHGGDGHDHPAFDTTVGSGSPENSGGTPVISVGGGASAPETPAAAPPSQAPALSPAIKTSDKLILPPKGRGGANLEKGTGPARAPASEKNLSDVLRKAAEDRLKKK